MKRTLIACVLAMLLIAGSAQAQDQPSPGAEGSPGPVASPAGSTSSARFTIASGYVLSCATDGGCGYLVVLIGDALPGGVLGIRLLAGEDRSLTPSGPLQTTLEPGVYAVEASEWTTTVDANGAVTAWGRRVGNCAQSFEVTGATSIALEIAFLRRSCTIVVGPGAE